MRIGQLPCMRLSLHGFSFLRTPGIRVQIDRSTKSEVRRMDAGGSQSTKMKGQRSMVKELREAAILIRTESC